MADTIIGWAIVIGFFYALYYHRHLSPQAKMQKAVDDGEAKAIACPHCKRKGFVERNDVKAPGTRLLLFGIFALGSLSKHYHCVRCNYKW